MPELPEVEVLVRHLAPLVRGRKISSAQVFRERVLRPTSLEEFKRRLSDATFVDLSRRAKYLLFQLREKNGTPLTLIGHLGMTGRMYLSRAKTPLPKHAAVVLNLGPENFIFEDTRYFGRLTFDTNSLRDLGPEPLGNKFTVENFVVALARSAQPIKVKLLDQRIVAGLGNIYASEALFRARISPRVAARRLQPDQVKRLREAIRRTLTSAIQRGSTVALNYSGEGKGNGLFYFGSASVGANDHAERLQVYDRAGQSCPECGGVIRRIVQAARSTFFCPHCQRG